MFSPSLDTLQQPGCLLPSVQSRGKLLPGTPVLPKVSTFCLSALLLIDTITNTDAFLTQVLDCLLVV